MSETGLIDHSDGCPRCWWAGLDPLYVAYHDTEWGVPEYDGRALYEKLILDGFQAGLSWITILRRREGFRRAFAGFGGPVPDWLAQVTDTGLWGLFRHQVAARWQDGTRAILGDAAHPTLPFLAQGACMAIEDAWVLAACIDADPDQPRALARYQALRRDRCTRIVAAATANARNYHLSGPKRLAGHTALRLANRLAPRAVFERFAWVYDHDPTTAG